MSHDFAIVQLIFFMHEPSPQITRHGRFAGHATSPWQDSSSEQSITHTPSIHVPFEQPCWQSAFAFDASDPLLFAAPSIVTG
jgi:hypothetical protein